MRFVVAPLRDRPEDIPPLARRFIELHCGNMRRPAPKLTSEAEAALLRYHWPGNVRELENVIERALALEQGEEIRAESLIFDVGWKTQVAADMACPAGQENGESLIPAGVKFDDLALREKRELIKRALQRCCGNRKMAAAMLGLSSRHRLYRLMVKLGVNPS